MNRFTEKFKSVDFGPQKCPNYPNYKHNKNFPQKSYITFKCLWNTKLTQSAFTCSKLTIGTLEQDVKYVQS